MTLTLIDIGFLCVLLFSLYFSQGAHFIKESVKLVGVWLSTFVALHYYISVSQILKNNHFFSEPLPELMAFILLVLIVIFIFSLIGDGWYLLLKFNCPLRLERLLNTAVSLIRTYLVFGLIFVALLITDGAVAKQARHSLSRYVVGFVSVGIYQNIYNDIVVRISPKEEINQEVIDIIFFQDEEEKPKDSVSAP